MRCYRIHSFCILSILSLYYIMIIYYNLGRSQRKPYSYSIQLLRVTLHLYSRFYSLNFRLQFWLKNFFNATLFLLDNLCSIMESPQVMYGKTNRLLLFCVCWEPRIDILMCKILDFIIFFKKMAIWNVIYVL